MIPAEIIDKVYDETIEAATRQLFQVLILGEGGDATDAKRRFHNALKAAANARKHAIDFFYEFNENNHNSSSVAHPPLYPRLGSGSRPR